jgi:hypothetical protein
MAILATEKVLTLDWWKPASKLQVGDYVFDQNGEIVQIKLVKEYRVEECYQVVLSDYLSVSGDKHLGFMLETPKYRKRLWEYIGRFKFRRPLTHKPLQELLEESLTDRRGRKVFSIPTTKPLKLPHQTLPVPPFVFGFWFFNRRAKQKLCPPGMYHEAATEKLKDYGYKIKIGRKRPGGRHELTITPSIESQLAPNIPSVVTNNYLLADEDQRIALLSGILMAKSNQYHVKSDTFRVTSQHFATILRIQLLVESLGSKTTIKHDEFLQNYTLFFKSRIPLVPNQVSPPVKVHHSRRYVTKITPAPAQLCVHIETSGKDNTILVGEGFIPCR